LFTILKLKLWLTLISQLGVEHSVLSDGSPVDPWIDAGHDYSRDSAMRAVASTVTVYLFLFIEQTQTTEQ
jgi:hypothetical protein